VLERWSQKVKRAYRKVEQIDELRAQNIDYSADQTMSLHSENALVTAEGLVKVDGEQIHLG
jgi:transglutaminase/protease-like cytokinesis protein 3